MSLVGRLTVDLGAIAANWRALDRLSGGAETAAVVKADGYGCGIATVGRTLAEAGARTFFVAQPEEGVALRSALGPDVAIYVLGGYPVAPKVGGTAPNHRPAVSGVDIAAERQAFRDAVLRPVLNGTEQVAAWKEAGAPGPSALQIDTGMNRLGLEASELAALGRLPQGIDLVMSHLACADTPADPMNASQLAAFMQMVEVLPGRRSLAATGGTLLGPDFHFDMVRPGVGLFGGLPFAAALPVVQLEVPILQVRGVAPGERVGYGNTWTAARPSRIATLSAGYADGLHRLLGNRARAFVGGKACPFAGRVSMDLIGLDVTDAPDARAGDMAEILGRAQTVDMLAAAADTIGYEILTALGPRYARRYV